jgi:hypothetical protein
MNAWLDLPNESWATVGGAPYVVDANLLQTATARLGLLGASVTSIEVGLARSAWDVVQQLKQAVPLPEWCGASWDSVDDAFEELRQALRFPVVLVVRGIQLLLVEDIQVGLETIVRLADLGRAFSAAGDQFVALYVRSGSKP